MKKAISFTFFGILFLLLLSCVPGSKENITPLPSHTLSLAEDTPATSTPIPSPTESAAQTPTEPLTPIGDTGGTSTSTSPLPPEMDELALPYAGYSFLVDRGEWEVVMEFDNLSGDYFILRHQKDEGCQINMPPDRAFSPMTLTYGNIGGRNWTISDNLRFSLLSDRGIDFNLHAPSEDCRGNQLEVLGTLRRIEQRQEPFITETALPTPTSLADSGFECPGVPPIRLKVGMAAKLISGETPLLFIAPAPDPDVVERQLSTDEDLTFHIEGGPACLLMDDGAYLYWEISIPETWEAGWVAEGTGDVYILEPFMP